MLEQRIPASVTPARFAVVDYDLTYLRMPLNWRLRIWGQGVGGYAQANGSVSRYADKARAEQVAQVWLETGIYPAFQTPERVAAARAATPKPRSQSRPRRAA